MYYYKVTSPSGNEFTCMAKNSQDAKKQACKFWGIKQSDPWCGMTAMKAKKISP